MVFQIDPSFGNVFIYVLLRMFGYPTEDNYNIINGNDVLFPDFKSNYNSVIFLEDKRQENSFCTGIILAEEYVAVAGHCVEKKPGSYKNYRVYVGSNKRRDGKKFELLQQYHMKQWKGYFYYGYDIMVLKVSGKIPFGDETHPASPATFAEKNEKDETDCYLVGFGANKNEGKQYPDDFPELLQKVQMPLINNRECKNIYGAHKIINSMGCAGYEKGGHVINGCGGDSGAPLFCLRNGELQVVAMFSYNGGCQDVDFPQIVTNITYPPVKTFLKKYRNPYYTEEMSLELEVSFCTTLLQLLDGTTNSTIFSPASLLSALAMVYSGSNGNTAKQIFDLIGKGKTEKQIIEYYTKFIKRQKAAAEKVLSPEMTKKKPDNTDAQENNRKRRFYDPEADPNAKVAVHIANGFFVDKKISLVPSYETIIKDSFNGQIQSTDFEKLELAVKEINAFVSEKTNKNINEIITTQDLADEKTSLILINAVHFIGAWKLPFDERKNNTFYSNPSREIPMMTNTVPTSQEGWNYQEGDDWQALGIPYNHCSHHFFIVLPKQKNGLSTLLKNFDYSLFKQCTKSQRPSSLMYVLMPIMEISATTDLVEKLQHFGITDVFSPKCDLSKMLEGPVKIEAAIHKAIIKVDELGTVASAATVFRAIARSSGNIKFDATHPFLYFITSNKSNNKSLIPQDILFMGTFC